MQLSNDREHIQYRALLFKQKVIFEQNFKTVKCREAYFNEKTLAKAFLDFTIVYTVSFGNHFSPRN